MRPLFYITSGRDPLEGTTGQQEVPDFTKALEKGVKGLRVGYLYHDIEGLEKVNPYIEAVLRVLEDMGAEVESAKAMDPHHAISVYTIVQRGEVSSNLARYDGIRYGHGRDMFGDEANGELCLAPIP